jgi:prephenate dehydrogenase
VEGLLTWQGKWDVRQAKPGARVVGQTNTDRSHSALKQLGIEARTKDQATDEQFANVIFCAPPSGSDDYQAEVRP